MKKLLALVAFVAVVVVLLIIPRESLSAGTYGEVLCHEPGYTCFKVPSGETWESLFPDNAQRNIVMRLNRINEHLPVGRIIAIPEDLDIVDPMQYSPMDKQIPAPNEKLIIVDPNKMAWGAYDENGNLVKWGPASTGQAFCPDIQTGCRTKAGQFAVYGKGGPGCISSKFPVPYGGAPMPYCMYFNKGYALHASELPGYNASHGCVRMFYEDAFWLSKEFVTVGTKVIIKPYAT
ncbi:MAG TPA: L,D-transpeptidase [Gammaproteobacteria bacterium]|nr:L,D-transpeptidase [Gammaproteobacteria bacterium]